MLTNTPPTISEYTFTQFQDAILYVPQGSLTAYQTANYWKNFINIKEFDPTNIEDKEVDTPAHIITNGGILFTLSEGKIIEIYTTAGALVKKISNYDGEEIYLDKDIYIIRIDDKIMKVRL